MSQKGHNDPSRRRILRLIAATSLAGLTSNIDALASGVPNVNSSLFQWRGTALGADASILIYHPDSASAVGLTMMARSEIDRLENIYSLYRPNSALVQLNNHGKLDNPPIELVELLLKAKVWSELSGGAFDVSIQPLWELYNNHYSNPAANLEAIPENVIAAARALVNFQFIEITPEKITLNCQGMKLTLNGIAQGDITDRVVSKLEKEGLTHSLINLGEMRAIDGHPDGRPWKVGIKNPDDNGAIIKNVDLTDRAMATSAVTGTIFDESGQFHHLFDPKSGKSSNRLKSASVIAKKAANADALSTAILTSVVPIELKNFIGMGIEQVIIVDNEDNVHSWTA